MFIYVTATWLIANLIHPFMLFVVFGWEVPFNIDSFSFIFQFLLYSILLSVPSLVLSQLLMSIISKLSFQNTGKYIIWLLIAPAIVFCNYWFLSALFDGMVNKGMLEFMLPAILSVVLTILIRFPAFFRIANALDKLKEEEDFKRTDGSF